MLKKMMKVLIEWAYGDELRQVTATPDPAEAKGMSALELETLAIEAAIAVRDEMKKWKTTNEDRVAISKMLPGPGASASEWSDALLAIQEEYILHQFYSSFEHALYKVHDQLGALPFKEYVELQLKIGVLRTQLVGLMAVAVQGLVKQAQTKLPKDQRTDLNALIEADEEPEEPPKMEGTPAELRPTGEVQYTSKEAEEIPSWLLGLHKNTSES